MIFLKFTYLSRINVKQCCSLGCAHCRGNRLDHLQWSGLADLWGSKGSEGSPPHHPHLRRNWERTQWSLPSCRAKTTRFSSIKIKNYVSFFIKCSYKQHVIIPPHDDSYIKRIPIQLKKSISWYYCPHWPTGRIVLSTTVGVDVLSIYVRPA